MSSRFFRPQLVVVILAATALGAASGGCSSQPSAKVAGLSLQNIDLNSMTLQFDVEVTNPYPLALPLTNLDYSLASGAAPFLAGKADLQGTVPALSSKVVSLPAKITYAELLSSLKGVKAGQVVPYTATMGLSVDVPATGALRLPMEKSGELPVPAVPEVKVEEIAWKDLSLDKAVGVVRMAVTNRNEFPLDLSKIDYALSLGGSKVASSSLAAATKLAASGGSGTVEIPITFAPKSLGLGIFNMLTGRSGGYDLSGAMSVNTPFGPMSLPLSGKGTAAFKR